MQRLEMPLGAHTLSIETGRMAKQADGAVVVRLGDTVVLATACAQKEPRVGVDFLPLTVDYRENTYAGGKIPGGFFKREGRPNEKEILTSRMIDRPLRPLFPEGWACETQVVGLLLSADMENDSDTLAIIGASTSLYISDIPFESPVAAVRVGYIDGRVVVNPSTVDIKTKSRLNLLVAGTEDAIVMVESGADGISEAVMVQALVEGHAVIKQIVALQKELRTRVGKPKRTVVKKTVDPALAAEIEGALKAPLYEAMRKTGKLEMYARMKAVRDEYLAGIPEDQTEKRAAVAPVYDSLREKILRTEILVNGRRLDGRRFDEIRNITSEVGVLPRTHGSALFTRGETQALVTVTLGTSEDSQIIDTVQEVEYRKRFMLHYNFPPFSVGEVKFLRGPGRREIGHGALAERAIRVMLPDEEAFPYTVRIVSDILESNGSSSMASICGGILALMDAGVPIKSPVAGVAMGLVKEGDRWAVLSDIAGEEDHYGDMDFKVAGTREGITALQIHSWQDGGGPRLAAARHQQLRAAHPHHQGAGRQDPRHHRAGRQDDPLDRGAHRVQDRRGGRRPRVDRVGGRERRSQGDRDHRGADRHRRAEQDLPGQGGPGRGVRGLRGDPARDGRPPSRLRDGPPPREGRAQRGQGRRPGPGEGRQHRSFGQDPPFPQGPARAGAGRRAERRRLEHGLGGGRGTRTTLR